MIHLKLIPQTVMSETVKSFMDDLDLRLRSQLRATRDGALSISRLLGQFPSQEPCKVRGAFKTA